MKSEREPKPVELSAITTIYIIILLSFFNPTYLLYSLPLKPAT